MKVCTLNTHSWLEQEQEEKLARFAHFVAQQDIAVIALQEVNQLLESPPAKLDTFFCPIEDQTVAVASDNYALRLVTALKEMGCVYYWSWLPVHIGYDRYQEGVGLLMKEPFAARAFQVSAGNDPDDHHTRHILVGQVLGAKPDRRFYSCHYSWWETPTTGFAAEWRRTQAFMAGQKGEHFFLGDFNNPAEYLGEGYQLMMRELKDAFLFAEERQGETTVHKAIDGWSENTTALRMDGVYYLSERKVMRYAVHFDGQREPLISDHAALLVEFADEESAQKR